MIILLDTSNAQSFSIIPRFYTSDYVTFTSESTGVTDTYTITATTDRYYHVISGTFDLVEGNYYVLKVYNDTDEIIYRDRVFVTNQTVSEYSVNDNYYVEYPTDNDFYIIS